MTADPGAQIAAAIAPSADQVISAPEPVFRQATVARAVRHAAGVAAATGIVRSTMFDNQGDELTAEGADVPALAGTLNLGTVSGSLTRLHGDTAAVHIVTAGDLHLRAGTTFRGWFGDGATVTLRVAAICRRGLRFANLTLPPPGYCGRTPRPSSTASFWSLTGQVLTTRAYSAPSRARSTASIPSPRSWRPGPTGAVNAQIAQNTWTIHVSVIVLLAYVVIAALNTLAIAALARRAELAILRLSGISRRQLLRMLRNEQAILLGLALTVGGTIAALTLAPMVKGTTGSATPHILQADGSP